jgi:uncharacterized protein (TIGR02145 family)
MKNKLFRKIVQTRLIVSLMMAAAIIFSACSKDDDNDDNKTPPHAASTQTWVIKSADGSINQTWSDAIHIPECNKKTFEDSYTTTECRSYTSGNNTWYYYNWSYVNAKAAVLCPSPWRVPTPDDFVNLDIALGGDGSNRLGIDLSWITANYINVWGGSYGGIVAKDYVDWQGQLAIYWSNMNADAYWAYKLEFGYDNTLRGVYPVQTVQQFSGLQVRCVK